MRRIFLCGSSVKAHIKKLSSSASYNSNLSLKAITHETKLITGVIKAFELMSERKDISSLDLKTIEETSAYLKRRHQLLVSIKQLLGLSTKEPK